MRGFGFDSGRVAALKLRQTWSPTLLVDAECGFRHRLAVQEQPPGEDPLESPLLIGEAESHCWDGPVVRPLRSRLDEVLPDGHQMRSSQDRFEPPPEGDRLPLVIGAAVPKQLVQRIYGEHRHVSSDRLG